MAFPWTPSKEGKKMARKRKRSTMDDFGMFDKPKRRKKRSSGTKTIMKAAPKRARTSKKAKTSKPKRKK